MKLIIILLNLILLTSCYDNVEIEDRAFVISVGIDKVDDFFNITVSVPDANPDANPEGKEDIKFTQAGKTILECVNKIDSNISQKLYFGQTKLIVFGKALLEDEALYRETIDLLERNTFVNKKTMVLATDKTAQDVLNAQIEGDKILGFYTTKYFKNYNNKGHNIFKETVEGVIKNSDNLVLPKITIQDEKINLGGSIIVKDYKYNTEFDTEQTKKFLLVEGKGVGTLVTVEYDNKFIPLTITNSTKKSKLEDDKFIITINLKGTINEFYFDEESLSEEKYIKKLESSFQKQIEEESNDFIQNFVTKQIDVLNIKNYLKKFYYDYKDVDIYSLQYVVKSNVIIENKGVIK